MTVPESPRSLGLRYKEWRPYQKETLEQILVAEQEAILIEALPGAGKSLVAAALSLLIPGRVLILTKTTQLMDQYLRDFPFMRTIRGKEQFNCLNGDLLVSHDQGALPLHQVKIGDRIISHTGKLRQVTNTMSRTYNGTTIKLRRVGWPQTITATPEHPFLVLRQDHEVWIPAKDLKKSDWLVEPIPASYSSTSSIRRKFIGVSRLQGRSRKHTHGSIRINSDLMRLVGYWLAEGWTSKSQVRFAFSKEELTYHSDVDALMIRFFGVARGFTVHSKVGNCKGITLCYQSPKAANFFRQFGDRAWNKRLPDWVLTQPNRTLSGLLIGYWRGDGHHQKTTRQVWDGPSRSLIRTSGYTFTTSSQALAIDLKTILTRRRLIPTAHIARNVSQNLISSPNGATPRKHPLWQLTLRGDSAKSFARTLKDNSFCQLQKNNLQWYRLTDKYIAYRIKDITQTQETLTVYNLSVETDESFIAGGVAVHNCILPDAVSSVTDAPCQKGWKCSLRSECPYYVQHREGISARVIVSSYAKAFSTFLGNFSYIICDEGHLLEKEIMNAHTIRLVYDDFKVNGITVPMFSSIHDAANWAMGKSVSVGKQLEDVGAALSHNPNLPDQSRQWNKLNMIIKPLRDLAMADTDALWSIAPYRKSFYLRPLWANSHSHKLFSAAKKVIIQSATILDGDRLAKLLGLKSQKYIQVPAIFPAERRPIYYYPVAHLGIHSDPGEVTKLITAIDDLLDRYKHMRGIIHSANMTLTEEIGKRSKHQSRLVVQWRGKKRNEVIDTFLTTPYAVLVSPSVTTGLDGRFEKARFQIIAKMPFEDQTESATAERMEQDKQWYAYQTAFNLQQACGRVVRDKADFGETILLDDNFEWFARQHWDLFSPWFREALKSGLPKSVSVRRSKQ